MSRPTFFRMWKEYGVPAFYTTVDKSKPIIEYKDKVVELLSPYLDHLRYIRSNDYGSRQLE
eukprot:806295-Ditylum_brightwellii.AAC.1